MTGPTHILCGLTAGIVVQKWGLGQLTAPLLLVLCIGALAPDIDGDGSITRPGKILRRFLPKGVALMIDSLVQVVVEIVQALTRHRGVLHWPLVGVILLVLGIYLKKIWLFWFAIGYISHLLADACTKSGIPILAPFRTKPISFSPVATGSTVEAFIAGALAFYVVLFGWKLLPEETVHTFQAIYKHL